MWHLGGRDATGLGCVPAFHLDLLADTAGDLSPSARPPPCDDGAFVAFAVLRVALLCGSVGRRGAAAGW